MRTQINNTVAIKPYQGPYKVYIIPEADIMTVQAQNALLKTIEEPPQYAVFILLTENADVLLPTINSRCVMLKLRYIKDALIKKYLMERMEAVSYTHLDVYKRQGIHRCSKEHQCLTFVHGVGDNVQDNRKCL